VSDVLDAQLRLLPDTLGQHLLVSLVALLAGLLVSAPLAAWAARRPKVAGASLGVASVIQTIPSLALLALMVPLLVAVGGWAEGVGLPRPRAIGFLPVVIALTLYSLLPILRNAITGLRNVDATLVDAARGLGMTERQVLLRVQLPLALPVIIAGIRTATVWVVGMATLSTAVGQTSLGNHIFGGLQTRNWTAVLVGCVAAALLAIVLDQLIGLGERASRNRNRAQGAGAAAGLLLVVVGGLSPIVFADDRGGERPLVIGAKNFNEQFILADLLADRLRDAGLPAVTRESLGSTVAFDALAAGELDLYVDYSGTLWRTVLKRQDTPDAETVLSETTAWLQREVGVRCLGRLGFENAYALAVRAGTAEALGLSTITDLVPHAPSLSIGSDIEFFNRPEWPRLRDTYGLAFAETVSMQPTLMYRAASSGEVDVITAFSSDGRIAAYDLVVLDDARAAFPPYDAVLLLGERAAARPEVVAALSGLLDTIDVTTMRRANQMVDVDGRPVADAATWLANEIRARSR
jgi:osmoprotectant transport system permease protein